MNNYLHNIEKQYDRHRSYHRGMLWKSAVLLITSMIMAGIAIAFNLDIVILLGSVISGIMALLTFVPMSERTAFGVDELITGKEVDRYKIKKRMMLGGDGSGDISWTIKFLVEGMVNIEKQCSRMGFCHIISISCLASSLIGLF